MQSFVSDNLADQVLHGCAEQIKVGLVADRSATFNKHLTGQAGGAGGGEALEREEGHSKLPSPWMSVGE